MPDLPSPGRYVSLPQWLRDELHVLLKKQMAFASQMQMRLIDSDRAHEGRRGQSKVKIETMLDVIFALDRVTEQLDEMVAGTRVVRDAQNDVRRRRFFYEYCRREAAYVVAPRVKKKRV